MFTIFNSTHTKLIVGEKKNECTCDGNRSISSVYSRSSYHRLLSSTTTARNPYRLYIYARCFCCCWNVTDVVPYTYCPLPLHSFFIISSLAKSFFFIPSFRPRNNNFLLVRRVTNNDGINFPMIDTDLWPIGAFTVNDC